MDDAEFLGKVDELFEWFTRQAGEGSIENWTLAGIQTEIRRRIMERQAGAIAPESEEITIEAKPIHLSSESTVRPPAKATIYDIALFDKHASWDQRFLTAPEARAFLKGVEAAASFGLSIKEIPEIPEPRSSL